MKNTFFVFFSLLFFLASTTAQIQSLQFDDPNSFTIKGLTFPEKKDIVLPYGLPLYSVMIDSNFYNSYCSKPTFKKDEILFIVADSIEGVVKFDKKFKPGIKYTVRFTNQRMACLSLPVSLIQAWLWTCRSDIA
jgi:hypothetical protein